MAKRKASEAGDELEQTPSKRRQTTTIDSPSKSAAATPIAETPSKQKPILKRSDYVVNGEATPKSLRKVLFTEPATPSGRKLDVVPKESPLTAARNVDRSARRKSAKRLIERAGDGEEDEDGVNEEDALAEQILGDDNEDDDVLDTIAVAQSTPTKTGELRGRPKGRRRQRSPTPPQDLPPHELFFFQNRPGTSKTSTNTLASKDLLNHDDYFAESKAFVDPHDKDKDYLARLHKRGYDQWVFELEQGFNICLYGYGSKRNLVLDFAEHLHGSSAQPPIIVVVNGYTPLLSVKDILNTVANAVIPKTVKVPAQPAALVDFIHTTLSKTPQKPNLHLIVHSLDAHPLRKQPTQAILAQLASSPHISLIATADTPSFPSLWDISLRSQYHFLFHDTTTFAPYTSEIDVVDEVNSLLGRSGRRVGGKDGVSYVLRSLPENARSLFRILVAEQLVLMESAGADAVMASNGIDGGDDDDEVLGFDDMEMDIDEEEPATPSKRVRKGRPAKKPKAKAPKERRSNVVEGIEYRTLYHKAVEEFVCSSEVGFRTLLKEFHDHQMIESRKDGMGTERLSVPFGKEELGSLLEELI
ncbi:hypothetical protein MBLNU457_1651t1 [Dothideomycetes sp. NU457]